MVTLNIDMPTSCMNCPLLGKDSMYCQVYPREDLNLIDVVNSKPEWCPIVADSAKIPKNGERFSCPNCGFKADWYIPSKEDNTKESK